MTQRPREPGHVPPVSYEDVLEYEPYPDRAAEVPGVVTYEPDYPQQTMARVVGDQPPTIAQAVRALLRDWGAFHGRTSRPVFWLGTLGLVGSLAVAGFVVLMLTLVVGVVLGSGPAALLLGITGTLLGLAGVGAAVTLLSGGIRRLHDSGLPGWLLALWFLPFGWIAVVVLLARTGQPGRNGFGPDPAAR